MAKHAKKKPPQSGAQRTARQQLILSQVLGVEANAAEASQLPRSPFGRRKLRSGGALQRYTVGRLANDSGYKKYITGGR